MIGDWVLYCQNRILESWMKKRRDTREFVICATFWGLSTSLQLLCLCIYTSFWNLRRGVPQGYGQDCPPLCSARHEILKACCPKNIEASPTVWSAGLHVCSYLGFVDTAGHGTVPRAQLTRLRNVHFISWPRVNQAKEASEASGFLCLTRVKLEARHFANCALRFNIHADLLAVRCQWLCLQLAEGFAGATAILQRCMATSFCSPLYEVWGHLVLFQPPLPPAILSNLDS